MDTQIEKSYKELVELKYQLYNSLFLTLPLDAVEQTGLLLPLLQKACIKGFEKGISPDDIINEFFREHKAGISERERISFLFKIIQYVERQIVLIDALEESAYTKIHRINDSNSWGRISEKVKRKKIEDKLKEVFSTFGIRLVLTAHPTQFYPGSVLAITTDITNSISNGNIPLTRDLLMQLGKTPFYRKQKPTAYSEAVSLIWYLSNVLYPAAGTLLDNINRYFPESLWSDNKLISLGFWPGGDRDGNPYVTTETTLKVASRLREAVINCYYQDIKILKRRLSFEGVLDTLNHLDEILYEELKNPDGDKNVDLEYFLLKLNEIENVLISKHQSLFIDKLRSFIRKVKLFGFYFASIDIRQDSRVIAKAFDALIAENTDLLPLNYKQLPQEEQLKLLLNIKTKATKLPKGDALIEDTLNSFAVINKIQKANGQFAVHRYIISNCRGPIDMARVVALARLCAWGDENLSLDIVPLFETIDDLKNAGKSMSVIYSNQAYKAHLIQRKHQQTVMLGFSDGTKDGGYLMANWAIYRAKEDVTAISRSNDVEVVFFDGRGGPPARGGGNTHKFYSALGKTIESKQIQITVQGQTISSHYGIKEAAVHNMGHLLTAGIENNLFKKSASILKDEDRLLIQELSETSFEVYDKLKKHKLFIPFLEERSTLKYYNLANIGSRPAKRGNSGKLKLDDLRAIPFVGAWSQLKQNVPGFYGLGSALKQQEEKGNLSACIDLYNSSVFFKALIANSMQSMSKTNFKITSYMKDDEKFGPFWKLIYDEFLLSREMVLKVSGYNDLLQEDARSKNSIGLREKVVLPLLTIQQYALMKIQQLQNSPDNEYLSYYERMVMRSLFGNINASRNSV